MSAHCNVVLIHPHVGLSVHGVQAGNTEHTGHVRVPAKYHDFPMQEGFSVPVGPLDWPLMHVDVAAHHPQPDTVVHWEHDVAALHALDGEVALHTLMDEQVLPRMG